MWASKPMQGEVREVWASKLIIPMQGEVWEVWVVNWLKEGFIFLLQEEPEELETIAYSDEKQSMQFI